MNCRTPRWIPALHRHPAPGTRPPSSADWLAQLPGTERSRPPGRDETVAAGAEQQRGRAGHANGLGRDRDAPYAALCSTARTLSLACLQLARTWLTAELGRGRPVSHGRCVGRVRLSRHRPGRARSREKSRAPQQTSGFPGACTSRAATARILLIVHSETELGGGAHFCFGRSAACSGGRAMQALPSAPARCVSSDRASALCLRAPVPAQSGGLAGAGSQIPRVSPTPSRPPSKQSRTPTPAPQSCCRRRRRAARCCRRPTARRSCRTDRARSRRRLPGSCWTSSLMASNRRSRSAGWC